MGPVASPMCQEKRTVWEKYADCRRKYTERASVQDSGIVNHVFVTPLWLTFTWPLVTIIHPFLRLYRCLLLVCALKKKTHPHQIHLPSFCSVLSQGILTSPPLLLGKVRPLLKIGITILLLVSMHITHLLSSWFKRPLVFSPVMCISQSITSAIPPSWFQIGLSSLQNFQANTKVTFNQSSSAKWAHWTTLLTCPVPSLYCAFTQTCSLPPMS